jgi:hypothetical protein
MFFAWIVLSSTGILFARYYKFIFPKIQICSLQIWFVFHRSMMQAVVILSLAGLVLILFAKNWTWVEVAEKKEFTHSILGILAISFAFLQVTHANLGFT